MTNIQNKFKRVKIIETKNIFDPTNEPGEKIRLENLPKGEYSIAFIAPRGINVIVQINSKNIPKKIEYFEKFYKKLPEEIFYQKYKPNFIYSSNYDVRV